MIPKFAGLKQSIFVGKIAICVFNSSQAVNYEAKTLQARKVANIHWDEKAGYYVAVKLTLLICNKKLF